MPNSVPQALPDTLYIKATRPDVLLRNPASGEAIPPEGATVTLGPHRIFWLRRIQDGDAVECKPFVRVKKEPLATNSEQ